MTTLALIEATFLIQSLDDKLQNKEIFTRIEPIIIHWLNDLNNKISDASIENEKMRLMNILAASGQRKYMPMIWSKPNEFIQKLELTEIDRSYVTWLAGSLFKNDGIDILQHVMDLFHNKDLQRELAQAIYFFRPNHIVTKYGYPEDRSKVSGKQYILDRLVHDVIPSVQDDVEVIDNLASYILNSGSKHYIEMLKEKLPYLSELKKAIISRKLK